MAFDEGKKPGENLKDKLISFFSFQAPPRKKGGLPPKAHFSIWYFVIVFLLFTLAQQYFLSPKVETIPYSRFKQYLAEGQVNGLMIGPDSITRDDKRKRGAKRARISPRIRVEDPNLVKELDDHKVNYSGFYESKFLSTVLSWILPIGIFFLIWRYAMKKMGPGQGVMSFSKSKAKLFAQDGTKVTFADVAGIDEAKDELQEVVEFLKNPGKFQKLGGKIPKGVLLLGATGDRQNPAGQGGGRRGQRAVLQYQRFRVCGNVRRRRGCPRPRSLFPGDGQRSLHYLY